MSKCEPFTGPKECLTMIQLVVLAILSKTNFDQFSRHFRPFGTSLVYFIFPSRGPSGGRGGGILVEFQFKLRILISLKIIHSNHKLNFFLITWSDCIGSSKFLFVLPINMGPKKNDKKIKDVPNCLKWSEN